MNKMKTKTGFTLTELVVALAVLSIIAAVTIPALITATNKNNFTNGLKRANIMLKTATNQILMDNNGSALNLVQPYTSDGLFDLYCSKLNCIKKCPVAAGVPSTCWAPGSKTLDGANLYSWGLLFEFSSAPSAVLANGMSIGMFHGFPTCNSAYVRVGASNLMCAMIWVDVNGFKKPNQAGRDIFKFYLYRNGFVPTGTSISFLENNWSTVCNSSIVNALNGEGCAARVLIEGAMNY